jgi:hypothetical protein
MNIDLSPDLEQENFWALVKTGGIMECKKRRKAYGCCLSMVYVIRLSFEATIVEVWITYQRNRSIIFIGCIMDDLIFELQKKHKINANRIKQWDIKC